MKLRDYCKEDAKEICKWINDEKSLRLWSADRYKNFPITDVDINSNYDECIKNGNFYPKALIDDCNNIIGHLILRNPNGNREIVRLGFIIVDDSKRGKGYGRKLVDLAIEFAQKELNAKEINLGVFSNNKSAYNCYESCGFRDISIEENAFRYYEENWDIIEMKLIK